MSEKDVIYELIKRGFTVRMLDSDIYGSVYLEVTKPYFTGKEFEDVANLLKEAGYELSTIECDVHGEDVLLTFKKPREGDEG